MDLFVDKSVTKSEIIGNVIEIIKNYFDISKQEMAQKKDNKIWREIKYYALLTLSPRRRRGSVYSIVLTTLDANTKF